MVRNFCYITPMQTRKENFLNKQKKVNDNIRDYFQLCIKSIDKDNLHMLRKVCMYISMVYMLMFAIAFIVMPVFKIDVTFFLVIPLLAIYFFVNLHISKLKEEISTNATGLICGAFYFSMCIICVCMDVFGNRSLQMIWTPLAFIVFPMVYIDKMYKYGIEELLIILIYAPLGYFNKSIELFRLDLHILVAAYIIAMICAHIILEMRSKAGLTLIELKKMSAIDKLTHVLNKGALLQKIDNYYLQKEAEAPSAMLIIDLDDFKQVNDNLGHNTGDLLLERVGTLLISSFRVYDIIGRYGGDEFVVLMPNMTDPAILQLRCRTLQMFLADVQLGNGQPFSVSIGAVIDKGYHASQDVFRIADDALYKSKIMGKNCVTTWMVEKEPEVSIKPIIINIVENEDDPLAKLGDDSDEYLYKVVSDVDESIRTISQYRENIKAIVVNMAVEMESDGIILRYIKTREGFSNIPVLAIASTDEEARKAKKLGANKVQKSDLAPEKYRNTINKLISMEEI